MPEIQYIKDDEHESSGRTIPKGSHHIVSRDFAHKKCEVEKVAVIVGSKSGRGEQDRARALNNLQNKGEKSQRLKKESKSEKEETAKSGSSGKTKSTKKSKGGNK